MSDETNGIDISTRQLARIPSDVAQFEATSREPVEQIAPVDPRTYARLKSIEDHILELEAKIPWSLQELARMISARKVRSAGR